MYQTAPFLQKILSIKHGFFGHDGGVSEGEFATLNTSYAVGDSPHCVTENRRKAREILGSLEHALVTLQQVHGSVVYPLTPTTLSQALRSPPQADGLVTKEPGILLGLLTADCAPVLWVDPHAGVIGACHAGWRGALGMILEQTLLQMEQLGAQKQKIHVAIGPMIHASAYTVDSLFYQTFLAQAPFSKPFFSSHSQGYQFDLSGFIQKKLERLGIGTYECLPHHTFDGPFFSYRRTRHQGKERCGRNLSLIQLIR